MKVRFPPSGKHHRYIPIDGWSPLGTCEYEVRVVKTLPKKTKGGIDQQIIAPLNTERDEETYLAAKKASQDAKTKEEKEVIRLEASKALAAQVYPRYTGSVRLLFISRAFAGAEQHGAVPYREEEFQEHILFLKGIPDAVISRAKEVLAAFSKEAVGIQKNHAKKMKSVETELQTLEKELGKNERVKTLIFDGEAKEVSVDMTEWCSVYGKYTEHWGESPDGWITAGSGDYVGHHHKWVPIYDERLKECVRNAFKESLLLMERVGLLQEQFQDLHKKSQASVQEAWGKIVVGDENKVISKTAEALQKRIHLDGFIVEGDST